MPRTSKRAAKTAATAGRPSALVDTWVNYCGDNLEQLRKLPDGCVDLVSIDPRFNTNRNDEVIRGELTEPRPSGSGTRACFEDRHASTQTHIDYMRPRCVELAGVVKKT